MMKISVVIESSSEFDPKDLIDWLNDEFSMHNMGTGDDMWATDHTVIEK